MLNSVKFKMEMFHKKSFRTKIVSNDYRIECLSPATFPGAIKVIKNAFCQEEYVNIGTKVNKNPVAIEELLELCAEMALDGVSLVAVSLSTEEVVAVAFNKIQVRPSCASEKSFFEIFAEERCTQESSRALIKFMADIDGKCNLFEKYAVDCSFEITFLATLHEHRKQKLGTFLCTYSMEIAKLLKNGPVAYISVEDVGLDYSVMRLKKPATTYPKICQAIWTSVGSQKIGQALNFTVHLRVPLKEFYFEGKSYCQRIGNDSAFCEVAGIALY